jgi:hypothetical protein
MAQELDVYRDWLGVTETTRPLNHYQLLRLKLFEDDASKVRDHYRKLNAHVRKYATGDYSEQSQDLLNELAKAMLCLTDAQRKREYDVTLGRKDSGEGHRRTLEEILLANQVIDPAQLEKARRFADQVGLEVRDAILQQKLASADTVMLAYAESQGLPYVELDDVGIDEALVAQIPAITARQHSCVPIMADGGQLLMASPNPLVPDLEEELRLRLEMPVRTVLCTPQSVNQAITKYYSAEMQAAAAAAAAAAAKKAGKKLPKKKAKKLAAAAKEEGPVLTQDQKMKRWFQSAIVGFNIAVILTMIVLYGFGDFTFTPAAAIGVLFGFVVAGGTFLVMKTMDL